MEGATIRSTTQCVNLSHSNNHDSQKKKKKKKIVAKNRKRYSNSNKLKERVIILIEIAFEAAVPLGGRSGDRESREELGDRSRRR